MIISPVSAWFAHLIVSARSSRIAPPVGLVLVLNRIAPPPLILILLTPVTITPVIVPPASGRNGPPPTTAHFMPLASAASAVSTKVSAPIGSAKSTVVNVCRSPLVVRLRPPPPTASIDLQTVPL